MRLSEAILLGRVLVPRMRAGSLHSCALGMAARAVGIKVRETLDCYQEIEAKWPWLLNIASCPVVTCVQYGYSSKATDVIWHFFDTHVIHEGASVEELVDYVRRIEPEPSEQYTKPEPTPSQAMRNIVAALFDDDQDDE